MTEKEMIQRVIDGVLEVGRLYEAGRFNEALLELLSTGFQLQWWLVDQGYKCEDLVRLLDEPREPRPALDILTAIGRALGNGEYVEVMLSLQELLGPVCAGLESIGDVSVSAECA